MAAKTTHNVKVTLQNEGLRRYWSALIIVCLAITAIGSAIAGAQTITILYRSATVTFALWFLGHVIIKTWSLWEEMKRREAESRHR